MSFHELGFRSGAPRVGMHGFTWCGDGFRFACLVLGVVAVVDAIISVNALNASNRICQCIECKWHEGVFAVVDAGVSGNALHARWPCYAREGLVWWEEMPEK